MQRIRLAYLVSHPIQYQAELLRRIAADPQFELTVIYCSDFSVRPYADRGFGGATVHWDTPLLGGYRHHVLRRWRDEGISGPFRLIARGILRYLKRGPDGRGFHLVWVHGYATVNAMHAMLAAKLLGLPVLIRSDSWLGDRERSGWKLAAKAGYFRLLRSLVSGVLTVGEANAEYWTHHLGSGIPQFRMPYAVDNNYFAHKTLEAAPRRAELQAELSIPDGAPVILFASKLQRRKHADHLLEAYLRLTPGANGSMPYLVIVGEGEQRAELEARVAEAGCTTVRFAGFRNQSELPRFFDLASIFVLPSRHEPWGLVVNEAMAAGLPVIVSSDVGCAPDLVQNGVTGMVYPVGNIEALHRALEMLLVPGAASTMGHAAREYISRFNYEGDVEALRSAAVALTGLGSGSEASTQTHPAGG